MLNDRILQISVYWHKELDAYDIHIIDVTERKLAEEQVNHLAFYNQETNLPVFLALCPNPYAVNPNQPSYS